MAFGDDEIGKPVLDVSDHERYKNLKGIVWYNSQVVSSPGYQRMDLDDLVFVELKDGIPETLRRVDNLISKLLMSGYAYEPQISRISIIAPWRRTM